MQDTVCDACIFCESPYVYMSTPCGDYNFGQCSPCTNCPTGQYQTAVCQGLSPRQCSPCPVTSCPAGAYLSQTCGGTLPGHCSNCTTCKPGQYVFTECQSLGPATARVCGNCALPKTSLTTNSPTCNACVAGYALDSGVCRLCGNFSVWVTNCVSVTSYVSCPGGLASYVCKPCTGSGLGGQPFCPKGMQASKSCAVVRTDGGNGLDAVCQPCPPGTYNALGQQLFCTPCPVGTYSNGTGSTACYNCTSKPAYSTYLPWPASGGGAGTSACYWGCNSGFYVSGGSACSPCSTLNFDPSLGLPFVYVPWPGPTTLAKCLSVCLPGYTDTGLVDSQGLQECTNCVPGYYKNWTGNEPCVACTNAAAVANIWYQNGHNGVQDSPDCPWCVLFILFLCGLCVCADAGIWAGTA